MSTKRLLGVFAHPDDEGMIGGTLLHYNSLGVELGLVYATRGEVGEIADTSLATPQNLGQVREQEMRAAAAELHVNKLWFLDYRDSGMAGSSENQNEKAFVRIHMAEAVGKLVAIIREFQPQVIVTFDETGAYGHPDHVAIYQYTTSAFHAAADDALYPEMGPAFSASKLYYASFLRSAFTTIAEWISAQEEHSSIFRGVDPSTLGLADDQISVRLNVEKWIDAKNRSWSMHRTQANSNAVLAQIPEEVQRRWRSIEYFQLATSRVGADVVGENDLFAHVK